MTEGEGNSKKKSKKKAAELMLDKLQALHLPSVASKQKVKNVANKKKNRNLIKVSFYLHFSFHYNFLSFTITCSHNHPYIYVFFLGFLVSFERDYNHLAHIGFCIWIYLILQMQKANIEYGSGINPISRLIQIQQANRRREPLYTLVTEQGLPRRREFVIQVSIWNPFIAYLVYNIFVESVS